MWESCECLSISVPTIYAETREITTGCLWGPTWPKSSFSQNSFNQLASINPYHNSRATMFLGVPQNTIQIQYPKCRRSLWGRIGEMLTVQLLGMFSRSFLGRTGPSLIQGIMNLQTVSFGTVSFGTWLTHQYSHLSRSFFCLRMSLLIQLKQNCNRFFSCLFVFF